MPNINYELPDKLHRALKTKAAKEGITLKALILRLLSEGLHRPPWKAMTDVIKYGED